MFQSLKITNFGIFDQINWEQHQKINILIGENDTGKTYLLKLLYSIAKSLEEYQKRQHSDKPTLEQVLAHKLYWVFQPENGLGDLVKKGRDRLEIETQFNQQNCRFNIAANTNQTISIISLESSLKTNFNALFIPPKEILTALEAISVIYEQLKIFGFDDTYQDLIKALRVPASKTEIKPELLKIAENLDTLCQGKIIQKKQRFIWQKQEQDYAMSQTAEGIKKLSILSLLIRNQMLKENTIIFIDEPEVNLHPFALQQTLKNLLFLSKYNIYIYLATHSYTVIKQLEILAQKYNEDMSLCSLIKTDKITTEISNLGEKMPDITTEITNLREGMPDNPILEASLQLYEEDVRLQMER